MAASYIWKPSTVNSWKRGPVFLAPSDTDSSKAPVITSGGKTYTGKYINTNEGRHQWSFDAELVNANDIQVQYGDTTGTIKSGATSYEGVGMDSWQARQKGTLGMANNFDPTQVGYGYAPAYQGGNFPGAAMINYKPIKAAPYKFTDPQAFASKYGQFNREQTQLNFDQAQQMAMKTLDTELQGLTNYVPAASALKRSEISIDNIFNQAQRTAQVNQTLPGVNDQLNAQGRRADAYASGNLPDSMQNAALELGYRSQAADQSSAGGFGQSSSVARKASDLMSAEKRFQIGQYGEQLLGQNINAKSALNLAPTEYSNAGSQINVMPSISASQLSQSNLSELNANTLINPTNALSSVVGQNQFRSNMLQSTNQFNASNDLNAQQFNANSQNQFAMNKFNYDVGYAGSVAGAYQTNLNTELALQQQQQARDQANDTMKAAQQGNTISSIISGIGAGVGLLKSTGVIGDSSSSSDNGLSDFTGIPSSGPYNTDTGEAPTYQPDPITPGLPDSIATPLPDAVSSGSAPTYDEALQNSYIQPFAQVSGVSSDTLRSLVNPQGMVQSANLMAENAGLSLTPKAGYVNIGTNFQGAQVYSDPALANNQSNLPAVGKIQAIQNFVAPLGTSIPASHFDSIKSTASNQQLMLELDKAQSNGDTKSFINTMQEAIGQPKTSEMKVSAKGALDGVNTAYSAYNIYQNWDKMSGAQKSLAVASLGISTVKSASGTNLAKTEIPGTQVDGYRPLNVGTALNLAAAGYNAYEIAGNWGDINNAQRISGVSGTALAGAGVAKSVGLINGNGAVASYIPVAGGVLGAYQATQSIKSVSDGWGQGGVEGRKAGLMNTVSMTAEGAAIGAAVGSVVPGAGTLAGAAVGAQIGFVVGAISFAGMAIGTGKNKDQKSRDFFRSDLEAKGLFGKDENGSHSLTLADGTVANVGLDGHGGMHTVRNADALVGEGDKETNLRAYETDYTNNMDYASGMAGNTLTRLLYGGRNKQIDQMGSLIGNAFLGKVGHGQDMTPENFNNVMTNARGVYSQAGIKSKADGYALVDKALSEGRITKADALASQQTFNMMYDKDSYKEADKLMNSRMPAIRGMVGAPERSPTIKTGIVDESGKIDMGKVSASAQSGIYLSQGNTSAPSAKTQPQFTFKNVKTFNNNKEAIRERNRLLYQDQQAVA